MEIWRGFEPVDRTVATPGLDLWVFSQPYQGEEQGGDVYYVTLCGGGLITRMVVADVSGHGSSVAEFSSSLRVLLRKNINQKNQKRLVGKLNRQFAEMSGMQRFATALVTTYLASTDRLSICNAGHPRPLYYRATVGIWSLIPQKLGNVTGLANLPLGLDEETSYPTFDVALGRGDLLVFYTDALIEAALLQEVPIRLRRGGEPTRHTYAQVGQGADHLSQGCVLAANRLDIVHAKTLKRDHIRVQRRSSVNSRLGTTALAPARQRWNTGVCSEQPCRSRADESSNRFLRFGSDGCDCGNHGPQSHDAVRRLGISTSNFAICVER